MGEVAEMMDVSQSLLRFWEKEFDEIRPKRNKKGNRLFSEQDLRTIKMIYHLVKERGLKIAAAKRQLKLGEQPISREAAIVEKLHSIRAILMEVKQALDDDTVTYSGEESEVIESSLQVMGQIKAVVESQAEVEVESSVEVEPLIEEPVAEVVDEVVAETEKATVETTENEPTEKEKTKKKAPRKPRRPKYAFKEVELFSLDELDAMQPKPGERRGNGEVQQTLFVEE